MVGPFTKKLFALLLLTSSLHADYFHNPLLMQNDPEYLISKWESAKPSSYDVSGATSVDEGWKTTNPKTILPHENAPNRYQLAKEILDLAVSARRQYQKKNILTYKAEIDQLKEIERMADELENARDQFDKKSKKKRYAFIGKDLFRRMRNFSDFPGIVDQVHFTTLDGRMTLIHNLESYLRCFAILEKVRTPDELIEIADELNHFFSTDLLVNQLDKHDKFVSLLGNRYGSAGSSYRQQASNENIRQRVREAYERCADLAEAIKDTADDIKLLTKENKIRASANRIRSQHLTRNLKEVLELKFPNESVRPQATPLIEEEFLNQYKITLELLKTFHQKMEAYLSTRENDEDLIKEINLIVSRFNARTKFLRVKFVISDILDNIQYLKTSNISLSEFPSFPRKKYNDKYFDSVVKRLVKMLKGHQGRNNKIIARRLVGYWTNVKREKGSRVFTRKDFEANMLSILDTSNLDVSIAMAMAAATCRSKKVRNRVRECLVERGYEGLPPVNASQANWETWLKENSLQK